MKKQKVKPDRKLHLGYNPEDNHIYLGKQNGNKWVGAKRDVDQEYLGVLFHKFPPNSVQTITIDKKHKLRVIVVDESKVVTIDGKEI